MIGHLGLNVPDLVTARAYYDRLLPALQFEPFFATEEELSYRPCGGKPGTFLFFYPSEEDGEYSRRRTGLQHLAFMVPTRTAVRDAAALAVELGSEPVLEPQAFPQYPPPYFAAFWTDPFGFMLEAVCHKDRD